MVMTTLISMGFIKKKFNMSQDFDIFNDNIRQVCLYIY